VDLRTGLDRCGKSRSHGVSIPGPSSPQPVAIPTKLPGSLLFTSFDLVVTILERLENNQQFSQPAQQLQPSTQCYIEGRIFVLAISGFEFIMAEFPSLHSRHSPIFFNAPKIHIAF